MATFHHNFSVINLSHDMCLPIYSMHHFTVLPISNLHVTLAYTHPSLVSFFVALPLDEPNSWFLQKKEGVEMVGTYLVE